MSSKDGSASRIRIAIRVRPLNSHELALGQVSVMERINDNGVRLWDPTTLEAKIVPDISNAGNGVWCRDFFYDHCLWSVSASDNNFANQAVLIPFFLKLLIINIIIFNCC